MLSRAYTKPSRRARDVEDTYYSKSGSILEYSKDSVIGFVEDLPLVFCGETSDERAPTQVSLREVLRASVGVMGESRFGFTEKVVLLDGRVCAVKRFSRVSVGRSEFGKKIEKLASVSKNCEYLVPVFAYLYSRRIKLIVSDYFPMGSLADLLSGGRKYGHTALDWNQRLMIALCVAKAILFIHKRCLLNGKNTKVNIHGNIKSSNVMINTDFTACLSDYGFVQLVEAEEDSNPWDHQPPPHYQENGNYCNGFCQKCDVYSFGLVLLDMLGGSSAIRRAKSISRSKEKIKEEEIEFFEFIVEGKERKQALRVLDIALACTNSVPESRPSMDHILKFLEDVIIK